MSYRRYIEVTCEFIFPFQAILGVGGNFINLLVLLSKPMRSRTNIMLAFAAISDILFLCSMIPNNLSRRHDWVYERCSDFNGSMAVEKSCLTDFAQFYIKNKSHFTFFLNWFSGASSWLMVAVSFERLWAIKSPFSARINHKSCSYREWITIPGIFFFTALITLHMNFTFGVTGHTEGEQKMVATQSNTVVTFFITVNVLFQILLPMILLIVVNAFLIYYLRNRRQFLETATSARECSSTIRSSIVDSSLRASCDETPPLLEPVRRKSTVVSRNGSNNSSTWGRQLCKAERHITVTVAAIVSASVITHVPSAILSANMYIFNLNSMLGDRNWYTWIILSSSVVVSGKVANFFLFCMSSKHFRRQMKSKICWLSCLFKRRHRDGKTHTRCFRSIPLNQIGDSASNVPPIEA
ncbi:unnamed protein product [Auanema sp. JU1783]|nr:unnamed protein product [Auanema sp. JU1783]